jgi:chaperonin GroEL (HSP60 family)
MIETVSEIHKVLDPSSRDVEPVVIFARGFAEEVIATLNVNRLRQTLNVIPVRVPFDEFSANTIKDLGVVCNAHIVSSLTGELISQQKFEDLEVVDRITFTQGKTQIENEKGILGASLLSLELTEKRKEAKSAELIGLLDYRLRSLTSRSVRIRYDEDFRSQVTEIDLLLRTSRAILDAGVIDLTQVEDVVPACLQSAFQSVIGKSRTPKSVPTLTLLSTVKYGTQAAISLLSINAALLIDEE